MRSKPELPAEIESLRGALREAILAAIPDVLAIYVYGSRVRGPGHPGSDLDIALLIPRKTSIPASRLDQLRGDLEGSLGRAVDLSVLDPTLQLVHAKEVVAGGVPVYAPDEAALARFEMETLSAYARFCEDRKPVVAAYSEQPRG